jgi:hypothetical protein
MDTCGGRDGRPRSRRSRPSPSASASVAAAASFPSSPCPRSNSPVYAPLFVKELDTAATGRMSPVPTAGWRPGAASGGRRGVWQVGERGSDEAEKSEQEDGNSSAPTVGPNETTTTGDTRATSPTLPPTMGAISGEMDGSAGSPRDAGKEVGAVEGGMQGRRRGRGRDCRKEDSVGGGTVRLVDALAPALRQSCPNGRPGTGPLGPTHNRAVPDRPTCRRRGPGTARRPGSRAGPARLTCPGSH